MVDGLISINGFNFERKDRNINGDGVAMYIRDIINYVLRDDVVPHNLEMLAIEISKPKVKSFIVSTWYRPPNSLVEVLKMLRTF